MRPEPAKYFTVHDTSINIWRRDYKGWGNEDWDTHEAIRMLLVRYGFTFHQDPYIRKNHRCLAKYYHTGTRQDVHFYSKLSGRNHEILFYEDVIRDNSNGGRYHFDKLAKMPYQRRKKTQLAMRRVIELLLSLGFVDTSKAESRSAWVHCMQRRLDLEDFQGAGFYARGPGPYNEKASDGSLLRDGQVRYFWDYDGRLGRGTIMHNINNMWWVIAGPYRLRNIANFRFLDWQPGMPLKNPERQLERVKARLKKAVEEQDFERAIILRDRVRQISSDNQEAA